MKLSSNTRFFLNIFSWVMNSYGLAALLCVLFAAYFDEDAASISLGVSAAVCGLTGIVIRRVVDLSTTNVRPRMNYIVVIMNWLILIAVSSAVFFTSGTGASVCDSVFEAAAGLTATGTGHLGMQNLPLSMQLFRSMLNWMGGTGIILIAVSCISTWDFSGRALASVEIPGAEYLDISSSFKRTCRRMLSIYLSFTAAHFVLLCLTGMPVFTSALTALSNISTAGLQHLDGGMIAGLPLVQKIIITFFSFISSLNISFFLILFYGKGRSKRPGSEIIFYASRIIITAAVIAIIISIYESSFSISVLGDTLMQTVSCLSTSGYSVTDCTKWPEICQIIILLQMFIGSCAVSTGGGIKNERIIIGFRTVRYGLFKNIHPQAVKPIRFNKKAISTDHFMDANLYISLFMLVYIMGAVLLSIDNKNESIYDALNYSQAMLTNTGTTIAYAGEAAVFSPLSKLVMSAEMLCGRLEIYPVLMLFFKGFWKPDNR